MNLAKAILFMLCINLASWMVVQMGVAGTEGLTPLNVTQAYNATKTGVENLVNANPTNLVSLMTGYVWPALQFIWSLFSWAFFGLPQLLFVMGLPEVITYPLTVLWSAVWAIGLAEFIRGMKLG